METLNCDNSSLKNDREMVDHSENHKFEGASYEYDYEIIKSILTFFGVLLNFLATCEFEESFATFKICACTHVQLRILKPSMRRLKN